MSDGPPAAVPSSPPKRWPQALLIAFIAGVAGAIMAVPVSDWAMQAHHVSAMEGGRACAAIGLYAPVGFIVSAIGGFVLGLKIPGAGFAGYLQKQMAALLLAAALIGLGGGLGYATADHPPLIDGRPLELEIEVRVPTKGRSIDALRAQDFEVALVVSTSDRAFADLRWDGAQRTDKFITVPAWAMLNSRNADRQITAGVEGENRQIAHVLLDAKPRKVDETWSAWSPASERFDGSKPLPNDQYFVRYRVRFYRGDLPTPAATSPPEMEPSPTPEESPTPEITPTP